MCDARIRQHAFDVGLRNGGEVADDHRQRGQHPEDVGQVGGEIGEGKGEDSQQGGKTSDLRARGHERGHG